MGPDRVLKPSRDNCSRQVCFQRQMPWLSIQGGRAANRRALDASRGPPLFTQASQVGKPQYAWPFDSSPYSRRKSAREGWDRRQEPAGPLGKYRDSPYRQARHQTLAQPHHLWTTVIEPIRTPQSAIGLAVRIIQYCRPKNVLGELADMPVLEPRRHHDRPCMRAAHQTGRIGASGPPLLSQSSQLLRPQKARLFE